MRSKIELTPDQIAEIERRLSNDEPYATDAEVRKVFSRLTGRTLRKQTNDWSKP